MIDGPILAGEALAAGVEAVEAFVVPDAVPAALLGALEAAGIPCHEVTAEVLRRSTDPATPQGVAVVARQATLPGAVPPDPDRWGGPLLVLDAVAEPGNIGALLRSAEAAGSVGVVVGEGSADPWSPKVVRASAGSRFRIPVVGADAVALLRDLDPAVTRLAAAAGEGAVADDADLTTPTALVLGSESHGVSPAVADVVDGWIHVPTVGVESLNVAMAGTLLLFEAARQRRTNRFADSGRARQGSGR